MVLRVDEILRVINDLHRCAVVHGELDAVLRGNGILQKFLRTVGVDEDGHRAGGRVGNGNFYLGFARALGQFDLDGGGGVGIAGGLDIHGSLDRLAVLLRVLNGLAADLRLRRRLAFAVLDGGDGHSGRAVGRGGFGGLRTGGHAVFVGLGLRLRFRLRTVLGGDGLGLAFRHRAVLLGLGPGLAFDLRAVLIGHGLRLCFGFRSVRFRLRFRLGLGHGAVLASGGLDHGTVLLSLGLGGGAVIVLRGLGLYCAAAGGRTARGRTIGDGQLAVHIRHIIVAVCQGAAVVHNLGHVVDLGQIRCCGVVLQLDTSGQRILADQTGNRVIPVLFRLAQVGGCFTAHIGALVLDSDGDFRRGNYEGVPLRSIRLIVPDKILRIIQRNGNGVSAGVRLLRIGNRVVVVCSDGVGFLFAVIGEYRRVFLRYVNRLPGDGHRDRCGFGVVVVAVANDLILHGVGSGICADRNGILPIRTVQAVLHRAADGCTCGDKRLLLTGIHKVFLCGRRRDLTIGLVYLQINAFRGDVAIAGNSTGDLVVSGSQVFDNIADFCCIFDKFTVFEPLIGSCLFFIPQTNRSCERNCIAVVGGRLVCCKGEGFNRSLLNCNASQLSAVKLIYPCVFFPETVAFG